MGSRIACSVKDRLRPRLLNSSKYLFSDLDVDVRLHLNESPYSPPEFVINYVVGVLRQGNRYDAKLFNRFRELLADYVGVDISNVYPYLGGDGALRAIFYDLTEVGDKVTFVRPTYSMYDIFASIRGLHKNEVKLFECGDWWCLDLSELINKASNSYLVVIDDPNNPTGSPLLKARRESIARLAENVSGFLVIDETYYEFSKYTAAPLINEFPNIIVVRTLSKAFSLAGFRLGYIVGNHEVIEALSKAYTPFDIPAPSLAAGIAALENRDYFAKIVNELISNRDYLLNGLRNLGIKAYNSLTNFILIKDSRRIKELLLTYGIAIKDLGNSYYRISVGSRDECNKVLDVLRDVI